MSLVPSEYKELTVKSNKETSTLWIGMNPIGRQCFTLSMLVELLSLFHVLDEYGSLNPSEPDTIHYVVLQSDHPEIYNTGGDLEYFSELVTRNKSELLREYGIVCIDLIYWALTGGKRKVTMIANVAGDTLGGGFEAALACSYIFSEKRSTFSFPEALFGFFPGMGAYDLFKRFAGDLEADRAFITGKRYSAQELKLMGGIYSIVEEGQGAQKIEKFIEDRNKNKSSHQALHKIKQYQQNISYESLEFSIDLWVETAMQLTEKNLRMMHILTRRQKKKGSVNMLEDQNNNPNLKPLKIAASG